jgi:hypothetical protein
MSRRQETTMLTSPIKHQVYQTIEKLPARGLEDLVEFLDYLSFRYKVAHSESNVALGGLWKDVNFDVTDDEIRALRQQVTNKLLQE